MQSIWCDEAGQTGNKLIDEDQPFYVYSALAMERDRATEVLNQARRDYRLQGELKVKDKITHPNGRKALIWILETCAQDARIVIHEKKFVLACKFFEQMVEPIIAEGSSWFYGIGFHKYISHLLYGSFKARRESAEALLEELQRLFMADQRLTAFSAYVGAIAPSKTVDAELRNVADLVIGNSSAIHDDLVDLSELPLGRWVLDPTLSSIFSLLCEWGDRHIELDVYLDKSNIIKENEVTLEHLTGWIQMEGNVVIGKAVSFNAKSIQAVSSRTYPGVQIAEVFAGMPAYALKNPADNLSRKCLDIVTSCIAERGNVMPDPEWQGSDERQLYCSAVLAELAVRTRALLDLLDGFPAAADQRYEAISKMVLSRHGKVRNSPCACGSTLKFKSCHGR